MKKIGLALFALVLLTTLSTTCKEADDCENSNKMIIDHKGRLIEISANAWEAHCEHGDTFVECVPRM